MNPNDTEEAIWAFLCEAQLVGPAAAREGFLRVGRDPRPVMRAAELAFRAGSDPSIIAEAAGGDTQGSAAYYSGLYVGLWHEAHGDASTARAAIEAAVRTEYGRSADDYMASLGKVHCQLRGWTVA